MSPSRAWADPLLAQVLALWHHMMWQVRGWGGSKG